MSIRIVHHEAPNLKTPAFQCDAKIHAKLDDFELSALLNRSHCCAMVGRAGSGKTSIALSMLLSGQLFRKCFSKILVCMPATSRASLRKDPFKQLPPGQVCDGLDLPALQSMFDIARNEAKDDGRTLIILDDCQSAFKLTPIERLLVHMNNNRRHNRLCIWILCQNYVKMP